MGKFREAIQVGRNASAILQLSCVMGCHKDDKDELVYILFDWDECGKYKEARMGDWLCEDHNGVWHVLSNEEYEKQK